MCLKNLQISSLGPRFQSPSSLLKQHVLSGSSHYWPQHCIEFITFIFLKVVFHTDYFACKGAVETNYGRNQQDLPNEPKDILTSIPGDKDKCLGGPLLEQR